MTRKGPYPQGCPVLCAKLYLVIIASALIVLTGPIAVLQRTSLGSAAGGRIQ